MGRKDQIKELPEKTPDQLRVIIQERQAVLAREHQAALQRVAQLQEDLRVATAEELRAGLRGFLEQAQERVRVLQEAQAHHQAALEAPDLKAHLAAQEGRAGPAAPSR